MGVLPRMPGPPRIGQLPQFDIVRAAHTIDHGLNRLSIAVRRKQARLRPTAIDAYRGWHAHGLVHLRARCVESPMVTAPSGPLHIGSILKANLGRFTILNHPGVAVRAQMGTTSVDVVSDDGGYLKIELPVGDLAPGWHVLDLDPVTPSAASHATGRVLVPDPASEIAVISDIDDTILKTGLTQSFTAAGRTLLRDVSGRKPVPGMAELYQGLQRGVGTTASVPFFYVSTGSWNLYGYLTEFMNLHGFPRGPLFLTDWGPQQDRLMRDGREHKRETIRELLTAYPDYRFVLIGDVGQGDPETYELMAREFPGRIRAIFVIYVGSHLAQRSAEVDQRAQRVREESAIAMHYVSSAADAVALAWQMGLVDQETTAAVAAALAARSKSAPRLPFAD